MPVSGWFSSWARDAVSSPMAETRVTWASSWRVRCASSSARLRSVMSVFDTTAPPSGDCSGTTDIAYQRSVAVSPSEYPAKNPDCAPCSTDSMPRTASAACGSPRLAASRQTAR